MGRSLLSVIRPHRRYIQPGTQGAIDSLSLLRPRNGNTQDRDELRPYLELVQIFWEEFRSGVFRCLEHAFRKKRIG